MNGWAAKQGGGFSRIEVEATVPYSVATVEQFDEAIERAAARSWPTGASRCRCSHERTGLAHATAATTASTCLQSVVGALALMPRTERPRLVPHLSRLSPREDTVQEVEEMASPLLRLVVSDGVAALVHHYEL